MSLSLALYRAATALLEPLAPLVLSARARRGKEDPKRLAERLGHASHQRPHGPLVWLHGASVGEGLSILPLAQALRDRRPELNLLVTTGTATSAALLPQRLPPGAVHQFAPIDAPGAVGRFLDHWRPDLVVLVESEVWPNLITSAQSKGARLALVSARLSAASLRGWARRAAAARRLFSAFDLVMAQDDATAAGLARLGARDDGRLNLKLAGEPLPVDDSALADTRAALSARPLLLAASTHPGEEAVVLEAFAALAGRPDRPVLALVPRHPARGAEVADLARSRGLAVRRQGAGQRLDGETAVYVADALGELGLWFRLARTAFVGGSLAAGPGGHNPLEPARLAVAVATGPHLANWSSVYATLGDAVLRVEGAADLGRAFAEALDDPAAAAARAAVGRERAAVGDAALSVAADRLLELAP